MGAAWPRPKPEIGLDSRCVRPRLGFLQRSLAMATVNITLQPEKSVQKIFTASQLAEAIHGKRLSVDWHDDEDKLLESIVTDLAKTVKKVVTVDRVQTGNMDKRIEYATIKRQSVSGGKLAPGRHIVKFKVIDRADADEDGPDTVPVSCEVDEPPELPSEGVSFEALYKAGEIEIPSSKVAREVLGDKKNKDKAAAIYERGTGYKGHGPTASIDALHAHVTNRTALGFRWKSGILVIVGVGEKSDGAGPNTSGYNWTT